MGVLGSTVISISSQTTKLDKGNSVIMQNKHAP